MNDFCLERYLKQCFPPLIKQNHDERNSPHSSLTCFLYHPTSFPADSSSDDDSVFGDDPQRNFGNRNQQNRRIFEPIPSTASTESGLGAAAEPPRSYVNINVRPGLSIKFCAPPTQTRGLHNSAKTLITLSLLFKQSMVF